MLFLVECFTGLCQLVLCGTYGMRSKEEVERCKQKDLLEEMLHEMTGEFPALSRVFVSERDIFLANSLRLAARPVRDSRSSSGLITSWTIVQLLNFCPFYYIYLPSYLTFISLTSSRAMVITWHALEWFSHHISSKNERMIQTKLDRKKSSMPKRELTRKFWRRLRDWRPTSFFICSCVASPFDHSE